MPPRGGGIPRQRFILWSSALRSNSLPFYIFLLREKVPLTQYLQLTNGAPFMIKYLVWNFALLLAAVNTMSLNCEYIRKPGNCLDFFTAIKSFCYSAFLGPLQTKMTQISLPSHILKPHLKSGKGTHFVIRVELPHIGHSRGLPPGVMLVYCFLFLY